MVADASHCTLNRTNDSTTLHDFDEAMTLSVHHYYVTTLQMTGITTFGIASR
jgi:hypothetical protein